MNQLNSAEFAQMGFLVGLSLIVSLATLIGYAILIPRAKFRPDRFLVAVVGLLSFLHIFKLLQETGVWPMPTSEALRPVAGLLVAGAFMAAVFLLGAYRTQHRSVEYRLRLAEANEAMPATANRRQRPMLRGELG